MKKYVQTFEIVSYHENDEEAIQAGLNIARNQRKKYDNQCNFYKLHKIYGIESKEILLSDRLNVR